MQLSERKSEEVGITQGVGMPCQHSRCTLTLERADEERWIRNNRIERPLHLPALREMLHRHLFYLHLMSKRRSVDIDARLLASATLEVDSQNLCPIETLSHHQGDESGSRAHVQHLPTALRPCSQQNTVCAHLHATQVLLHSKLFESKLILHIHHNAEAHGLLLMERLRTRSEPLSSTIFVSAAVLSRSVASFLPPRRF